jgi:hypothetical protein
MVDPEGRRRALRGTPRAAANLSNVWFGCVSPQLFQQNSLDATLQILVRARFANGLADRTPATRTWIIDTTSPTTTAPTKSISGSTITSGKSAVRFTWSGSDSGSGIDHYQLALNTDGGSYATLSSSLTSPSYTRALAAGHTYRARVRAIDKAANVGAWTYGSSFRLTAYQESSARISWSGSWHTASSTSYWGGRQRYATAAGAKASLTFTGRNIAWVGSVGPTRGWARIYINGVYVKSISLYATSAASRRVLFTKSWSTSATRTITIRVSGTTGHPRVDVGAFVVAT